MIFLTRYYTPYGTWGDLEVEGKKFSTLERPWKGNKQSESCIIEGNFIMQMRESPVVRRVNGVNEGWEVTDVPSRKYIMVHSGNRVADSNGCLLIGKDKTIYDNELFITHSQDAFDEFMSILDSRQEWEIMIKPWLMEYP